MRNPSFMNIETRELRAISKIKNLKYVGEIREDSYKRAVLHTYDAAVHLYTDGYYAAAVQNAHWCADMAVKLYLWKKHLVNYTDYHNLPMVRILNWMPKQEEMKEIIEKLRQLHTLYEQFGDYMVMVEEYPDHLFGTAQDNLFSEEEKWKNINQKDNKSIYETQQAARKAVLLIDSALLVLLDFD